MQTLPFTEFFRHHQMRFRYAKHASNILWILIEVLHCILLKDQSIGTHQYKLFKLCLIVNKLQCRYVAT